MNPTDVVKDNQPASSQSNSSPPTNHWTKILLYRVVRVTIPQQITCRKLPMFNEQLLETYTNPTNDSIGHLIDLFQSYKSQRSKGKDRYKKDPAFADTYETRRNVQKV